MKKIIIATALICSTTLWAETEGDLDFPGGSGSEHFTEDIPLTNVARIGEIPPEIENLEIALISD